MGRMPRRSPPIYWGIIVNSIDSQDCPVTQTRFRSMTTAYACPPTDQTQSHLSTPANTSRPAIFRCVGVGRILINWLGVGPSYSKLCRHSKLNSTQWIPHFVDVPIFELG